MAELSYDDVRRAAQDAMRDLQNVVYGLQNSHNDLKRSMAQSANNQYQLGDIASRLGTLQQQINGIAASLRSNSSQQPAPIHYSIQQSVNELNRRMSSMEQFVEVCYRYFDMLRQQEANDGNFKSVS